jgi:membrane protease YdiL (CAAX protease family)
LEKENPVTLLGINMVFMITAVLLITLGYYFQVKNIYTGLIITEFLIIPVPALIYTAWKGMDVRETFRLRGISINTLWKCVLITLCAYPVGLFLNLLGNLFLGMLGELIPVPVPVAESGREYLINLLVVALVAGVAEEFFFRGFILTGYEGLGERNAVIISALLFGMFHFNIQNFLGPVFLGLVFGFLALRTGSVVASAAGHFVNNALSVTFMFVAGMVSKTLPQGYEGQEASWPSAVGLIPWGAMALAGGVAALRLYKGLERQDRKTDTSAATPSFGDFIPVAVTVIIFIVFCVSELLVIINGAG